LLLRFSLSHTPMISEIRGVNWSIWIKWPFV
jgi:hypothetical protein